MLDIIPATDSKLIEQQHMLEQLFNKNQLRKRVTAEFFDCEELNFGDVMHQHGIPKTFGYALLAELAIRKRIHANVLIGILMNKVEDCENPLYETAELVKKCIMADLCDYDMGTHQLIVLFEISQDVQDEIDRYQFPLPMVINPMVLTKNTDTGYVHDHGCIMLRNSFTTDDVCLDHLNRMNAIEFEIDENVLANIQNTWRSLDKQKPGETKQDFERRKKAFDKFDRTARDVIGEITKHTDRHFLTHRYDKRGRSYCTGYHVNYQGNPWNKAITRLAQKEIANG